MTTTTTKTVFTQADIDSMMTREQFSDETKKIIMEENLLPAGLVSRLHSTYPATSGFFRSDRALFSGKTYYSGLSGFREIIAELKKNGIDIGYTVEREFFIEVYRFLATKHVLNSINWNDYEKDSIYQLVIPQPEMIKAEEVAKYAAAKTDEERAKVVEEYQKKTNPHDGKQKLNKPWFINSEGHLEILQGCQHKYPPVALIFDKGTQNCFAFCTYCFRHAQVRGDEDMFVQNDVAQLHGYMKQHKEVTDILITGGDAGFITYERAVEYIQPIIEDPELMHIKTVRFGSRALTFHPEMVLTEKYKDLLRLFRKAVDSGIQIMWVAHFSTPREVLNPATVAAIRRLKAAGVNIKSQSPMMKHISIFEGPDGKIDVERSAQNWIDLGNIFAMVGVGFHAMYCARPTGEHHYFTTPLAEINKVFSRIYQTLASVNRPSRFITMTSSAGKISLLGTTEIKGEKVFVLKFNEGRNMDWMDRVYLAKYDEVQNTIEKLKPFEGEKFYYEDDLHAIETRLEEAFIKQMNKQN